MDEVVEFCRRNASFRSSSAICFSASAIFLSRSISSCRSLSISRLKRSFSRSSCSDFTGCSRRGWRCDALKHIHFQVFQLISRSKPKILKDFCKATFAGPELLRRITLDRAGRVVLPKALRDELNLSPGDTLDLTVQGDEVKLRPRRSATLLQKERGVWVFRAGQPLTAEETEETLRKIRAQRQRQNAAATSESYPRHLRPRRHVLRGS